MPWLLLKTDEAEDELYEGYDIFLHERMNFNFICESKIFLYW